jgi:hypothetical protein
MRCRDSETLQNFQVKKKIYNKTNLLTIYMVIIFIKVFLSTELIGWKHDYRLQIAVYDIIKLQQEAYGISA